MSDFQSPNSHSSTSHSSSFVGGGMDEWNVGSDSNDGVHGDRALWRAVITQALMDAGMKPSSTAEKIERARAIAWLAGKSKDFDTVCAFAGLDPHYVVQKASEAIKRGCTWRKPSTKRPTKAIKPKGEVVSLESARKR